MSENNQEETTVIENEDENKAKVKETSNIEDQINEALAKAEFEMVNDGPLFQSYEAVVENPTEETFNNSAL